MYADQARTLGDATGTSMTAKINTKISTTYGWNSSYNWAVIKSKQIWIGIQKGRPLLAVPRLYSFSKSQFISSTTNTAYTHTDIEYPIGCTTCGDATLDSVDVVAADAAWIFTINIPAFVFAPEKPVKAIVNCFAGQNVLYPYTCAVCSPTTPNVYPNLRDGPGGNHEIGIYLEFNDPSDSCTSILDGNSTDDINPSSCSNCLNSSYYSRVEALPGTYWRKEQDGSGQVVLVRSVMPHIIDEQGLFPFSTTSRQFSNSMTLCQNETRFFDYGSIGGGDRFGLDFGGIYKLSRPGIPGVHPMYFYFSPFRGLTYVGGPDMNLNYGGDLQSPYCLTTVVGYEQEAEILNSGFALITELSMTLPDSAKDYFANPSLTFLQNYWADNAIVVGFGSITADVSLNYVEFYADTTGQLCDPGSLSDVGALISTLECAPSTDPNEGDRYEMLKIYDNDSAYSPGTRFLVHVQARFANGQSIDACQYITLNSNVTLYEITTCMIRGDIEVYSSSQISYKVEVYETF